MNGKNVATACFKPSEQASDKMLYGIKSQQK